MTAHRPRRSTWLLMGLFLMVLALYVLVRPVPAGTAPVDLRQQVRPHPARTRGTPTPTSTTTSGATPSTTATQSPSPGASSPGTAGTHPPTTGTTTSGSVRVDGAEGARRVGDLHAPGRPLHLGLGRCAGLLLRAGRLVHGLTRQDAIRTAVARWARRG